MATTSTPPSSAGLIIDSSMVGSEIAGARILQARSRPLPLVDNDDVLQPSNQVPPEDPRYWLHGDINNAPAGRFDLNAQTNTKIHFDNPNWLGAVFPTLNPHGWASYARNYVQFNPNDDGGDFSDRRLTPLKYWRYQYANRASVDSCYQTPLTYSGMVSKQCVCAISANILYGRAEAYTKAMSRGMTANMARVAHAAFGTTDNTGVRLPAMQGTPEFMRKAKQNALTFFMNEHGADLFITMTYNPEAEELDAEKNGRRSNHCEAEITRLFELQVKALLKDIEGGLYGKMGAYVAIIE